MSAESELFHAYREWYRLAEAEAKAIQTRNWKLLSDCQTAIQDYQALVGHLTLDARAEWRRTGGNCAQKENHLQVFVNDLIELTRRNQGALHTARQTAQEKLDQIGEAGRNLSNLKLVHRSYGFVPAAACGCAA